MQFLHQWSILFPLLKSLFELSEWILCNDPGQVVCLTLVCHIRLRFSEVKMNKYNANWALWSGFSFAGQPLSSCRLEDLVNIQHTHTLMHRLTIIDFHYSTSGRGSTPSSPIALQPSGVVQWIYLTHTSSATSAVTRNANKYCCVKPKHIVYRVSTVHCLFVASLSQF